MTNNNTLCATFTQITFALVAILGFAPVFDHEMPASAADVPAWLPLEVVPKQPVHADIPEPTKTTSYVAGIQNDFERTFFYLFMAIAAVAGLILVRILVFGVSYLRDILLRPGVGRAVRKIYYYCLYTPGRYLRAILWSMFVSSVVLSIGTAWLLEEGLHTLLLVLIHKVFDGPTTKPTYLEAVCVEVTATDDNSILATESTESVSTISTESTIVTTPAFGSFSSLPSASSTTTIQDIEDAEGKVSVSAKHSYICSEICVVIRECRS
jgi:hypothetical protein